MTQGDTESGIPYRIKTDFTWKDRTQQRIRVEARVIVEDRGCLFGILTLFIGDPHDEFVSAPSGQLTGE